jgi:hypothetical protein
MVYPRIASEPRPPILVPVPLVRKGVRLPVRC